MHCLNGQAEGKRAWQFWGSWAHPIRRIQGEQGSAWGPGPGRVAGSSPGPLSVCEGGPACVSGTPFPHVAPRDMVPIPRDVHGVLKPTTDTLGPRSPREGVRVGPTTPAADPADEDESVTITEACAVRLYLPHWPAGPCGGCCSARYWGQRQAQAPGSWPLASSAIPEPGLDTVGPCYVPPGSP